MVWRVYPYAQPAWASPHLSLLASAALMMQHFYKRFDGARDTGHEQQSTPPLGTPAAQCSLCVPPATACAGLPPAQPPAPATGPAPVRRVPQLQCCQLPAVSWAAALPLAAAAARHRAALSACSTRQPSATTVASLCGDCGPQCSVRAELAGSGCMRDWQVPWSSAHGTMAHGMFLSPTGGLSQVNASRSPGRLV